VGDMREINALINRMRDTDLSTRRHAIAHELRHAVAALDAAEARAVGVKALVWQQREDYFWAADSVCGMIYISEYAGMELPFKLDMPDAKDTFHSTLELSQAAAQADYTARILSALHPASPLGAVTLAEVNALVSAATNMRDYGTVLAEQKYHRDLDAALAPFTRKGGQ